MRVQMLRRKDAECQHRQENEQLFAPAGTTVENWVEYKFAHLLYSQIFKEKDTPAAIIIPQTDFFIVSFICKDFMWKQGKIVKTS